MNISITFCESQINDSSIPFNRGSFNDETSILILCEQLDHSLALRNPNILTNLSQLALENAQKEFELLEPKLQPEIRSQFARYLKIILMPSIFRAFHDLYRITDVLKLHDVILSDHQVNLIDHLSQKRKKISEYYTEAHSVLSIHFLEKLLGNRSLMNEKGMLSDLKAMSIDSHLDKLSLLRLHSQQHVSDAKSTNFALING